MQLPFSRYLLYFGSALIGVVLVAWVYVWLAPMAFMESGYAAWAAKSTMLRECRLGQIAFFGDSRLEAGVIPSSLPVEARNFGLPAATAIETSVAVERAMRCPTMPRQAVIALVPEHFGPAEKFFWVLSLRYSFVSFDELAAIENLAAQLDDTTTLATPTPDGLTGRVRDWLYAVRFPSFSFASLVQGRIFGRYGSNRAHFEEVLRDDGWARYQGGNVERRAAQTFDPTKLQTAEFEAAIERLRSRGVEVSLLIMPFAASRQASPAVVDGYMRYLADVARRFPGLRFVTDTMPVWPDRFFADGAHLGLSGARAFSERLAACVVDGVVRSGCDLSWHESRSAAGTSAVLEVQQQGDRQH